MEIRGKARGFELNVQSHEEIEQICPDQDFSNFAKLFEGKTSGENVKTDLQIAVIMNKGFEDHRAFENPDYCPDYLTLEDMKFLTMAEIQQLENELLQAISTGQATTVEAEAPKASGKKSLEENPE